MARNRVREAVADRSTSRLAAFESLGRPLVISMGTGSEVTCGIDAHERLLADGIRNRVVSLPCWELGDAQPAEHRESVLPAAVTARVAVEQASTFGWERCTGSTGRIIGVRSFGPSAPLKQLLTKFGCTPDAVVAAAKELV